MLAAAHCHPTLACCVLQKLLEAAELSNYACMAYAAQICPATATLPAPQRLLEKMGWKEGEGLGRNRQGMATPLMMQVGRLPCFRHFELVGRVPLCASSLAHPAALLPHPFIPDPVPQPARPIPVQKTDVRTGVIVNAAPSTAGAADQPAKRQRTATFNRPPTRVVLLTNMVGFYGGLPGCLLQSCLENCTAADRPCIRPTHPHVGPGQVDGQPPAQPCTSPEHCKPSNSCNTLDHNCIRSTMHPQVGPGEVDGQLDGEVGEECSKYGTVTK